MHTWCTSGTQPLASRAPLLSFGIIGTDHVLTGPKLYFSGVSLLARQLLPTAIVAPSATDSPYTNENRFSHLGSECASTWSLNINCARVRLHRRALVALAFAFFKLEALSRRTRLSSFPLGFFGIASMNSTPPANFLYAVL